MLHGLLVYSTCHQELSCRYKFCMNGSTDDRCSRAHIHSSFDWDLYTGVKRRYAHAVAKPEPGSVPLNSPSSAKRSAPPARSPTTTSKKRKADKGTIESFFGRKS